MWKKLVLMGGLLACLGLPAFAAADVIGPIPGAKKTIPVELKGKLQQRVEPDHRRFLDRIVWEVLVDGKAYELDFDNKHDLWDMAEKSVNQTVLVKGTWDGDLLHVASLTADPEHVKKTVKVEVKGRLIAIYARLLEVPDDRRGLGFGYR